MKKILVIILLVVTGVACSETETLQKKDGVCYDRNTNRMLGLKVDTRQTSVDKKYCG